jgi:hypothetical protein
VVGSFKECQGAVKTFRAIVYGVRLGLKNVEMQNRDSGVEPVPKLMTDGRTVEAKQLKNRRVAETKWAIGWPWPSGPIFFERRRGVAPRPANPVMEEPQS